MKYYNYLLFNKYLTICFALFSFGSFKTQAQEIDSLIIWNKNYKLSWEDFLGKKNIDEINTGAISFVEIINIRTYYNGEILNYTVIPVFNRNKSAFVKQHDHLLEHEQLHFDIQEIFSRKIRKEFQQLKINNACDISYREIFNSYCDSLILYQKKYDVSTNYSLNKKIQNIWKNKITQELIKLDSLSIENIYNVKFEN